MQLKVRELGKYYIVEVVTLQGESHRVIESHVNKLTLFLVDDVVIANHLMAFLPDCDSVWAVRVIKDKTTVANANESLRDDVQLVHLHVLKINLLVMFVFGIKSSRL